MFAFLMKVGEFVARCLQWRVDVVSSSRSWSSWDFMQLENRAVPARLACWMIAGPELDSFQPLLEIPAEVRAPEVTTECSIGLLAEPVWSHGSTSSRDNLFVEMREPSVEQVRDAAFFSWKPAENTRQTPGNHSKQESSVDHIFAWGTAALGIAMAALPEGTNRSRRTNGFAHIAA
jgi:hypothetical protein